MVTSAYSPLVIIIPCFNEEDCLTTTIVTLHEIMPNADILCIDDGSTDKTWQIITTFHHQNNQIKGLRFDSNYGQQEALWAGLSWAVSRYQASITIDADLQDDPTLIPQMVEHCQSGYEVVVGVREERQSDSFFKRTSAGIFYFLSNQRLISQHGDFRLLSQKAMEKLLTLHSTKPLLRALIPNLGMDYKMVYYKRRLRVQGQSKYSLSKMVSLAWRILGQPRQSSDGHGYPHFCIDEELV